MMRMHPLFQRSRVKRTAIAVAGVLVLAIVATLLRGPHRQEITRRYPPSPSAAEESDISEPIGILESRARLAPMNTSRPQQAAPQRSDNHLTTSDIQHGSSPIGGETTTVGDSAVTPGGLSGPGVLIPHNLASKHRREANTAEGQVTASVPRADPPVIAPTPFLTPPVLLSEETLKYPDEAYRIVVDHSAFAPGIGIDIAEGRVGLKILVRADGSVGGVEVAQSSGRPFLDIAAVREVSRWKFAPATRDGQPIDAWALVPLLFVLR